jgi:propanol-preferring alcohol dehydrogenase
MRAAVLPEWGSAFEVMDIDTPEPGPGEVRVRIGASGACHSDLHVKGGEMGDLGFTGDRLKILGHENAGWVDALGDGVSGLEIGEPVAVFGGWGCGRCRFCLGGDEQLCNTLLWGGMGRPGGYAEQLIVPAARHLIPLGDLDPVDVAPMTDAALTPYRAVKKALPRLVPGSTAVVIGAGGLGQFGVQLVKALSPASLVVVETAADKRDLATGLGADLVLDPTAGDAAAEIKAFSGGEGATAVFDFVGVDRTMALMAASLGRQGLGVLVGLAGGSTPFSFFALAAEATLTSSNWGNHNELTEVLALARTGAITAQVEQYPLEKINDVFDRLQNGEVRGRAVLVP